MQNPGFLTLAAKLIVNVHDMNNEGSIGQTTDIRMIRMIGEDGKELPEVPAVSGRMMKHWHLAYMLREELNNSTPKLCPQCKTWEPERKPQDEVNGINACVICDVHGFLCTAKVQAPPRRSSCVSFSWLLPVLDAKSEVKQVIHSRVASAAGEGDEKSSQMIYYKNYASSIYAFVCSIDLDRIGKPLIGNGLSDAVEIKRRRQMAVKALLPMVMGAFGASQSHALPHTKCLGVLAALSDNTTPLPNLVSPIYSNGFAESINLLKAFNNKVKYWGYWGYGEPNVETDEKKDNLQALFDSIITELNSEGK